MAVYKCRDISWRCTNKKCKGRLRTDIAMSTMNAINLEQGATDVEFNAWRSTIVESRYLFYGFDNEIRL